MVPLLFVRMRPRGEEGHPGSTGGCTAWNRAYERLLTDRPGPQDHRHASSRSYCWQAPSSCSPGSTWSSCPRATRARSASPSPPRPASTSTPPTTIMTQVEEIVAGPGGRRKLFDAAATADRASITVYLKDDRSHVHRRLHHSDARADLRHRQRFRSRSSSAARCPSAAGACRST